MGIRQLHHASIVVDDLEAATAYFVELGMEVEGRAPIRGEWVDRINALDGIDIEIVMLRTPDGAGRLEVTKFHSPEVIEPQPARALGNVLGLRSVMFVVDDLDATVAGLLARGGELIGEVVQYENSYRLCYARGPADVIVAFSEELT